MFLINNSACCQSFINLRLIQRLILKKFSNLSITPRMREIACCFSNNNLADVIEAFNSTSRYLDDLLNIDNLYQIYLTELQLNNANSFDTKEPF